MGPVFRAYDAERERLVAVKLFKLDLPPEKVHRLVGEFERLIAAEVTHPAITAPLATGMVDVAPYLAQEFVAADSLDHAVREYGPAPAADAVRVAAQLAAALDFAAVVDVTHGALHPRDVLLSADETRLTGIGVAQALESIGIAAPVRRPYTAPERVAGTSWDRRADLFSLAALVHELLWGRRIAGTGSHVAEALTEIAGGSLPALQAAFARALAERPTDRFASALEFAEALKRAFPDVDVDVPARKPAVAALASPQIATEPEPEPKDIQPRLPIEVATLDLRPAVETKKYESVEDVEEEAPLVPDAIGGPRAAPLDVPPLAEAAPAPITLAERSRSAVWPLMAALSIGLAIGFAGGYGVGSRDRSALQESLASAEAGSERTRTPAMDARPAGREATEVAVPPEPVIARAPTPTDKPHDAEPAPKVPSPPPAPKAPVQTRTAVPRPAVRPPARPVERAATPAAPSATVGRFVGALNVDSRPTGARVFLDGRLIGTTPLTMPTVGAGEHAIRIERDGYRRWSSSIRVVASENNRVTASLER